MNAGGIRVFYGAFSPRVAIAELWPSAGGQVAVARFRLTKPVRLLDFAAFARLTSEDTPFRPNFTARESKREFLRTIGTEIGRPVQRHEEMLEYVPAQLLAEYLHRQHNIDGLIYRSAQAQEVKGSERRKSGRNSNVALFHHVARIENGDSLDLDDEKDPRQCYLCVEAFGDERPSGLRV